MHYISATRKKSCAACVKSKRRCDLQLPSCRRCRTKNLDCTYHSTEPRDKAKAARPDWPVQVSALDSPARFQLHQHNTTLDPRFAGFSTDGEACANPQDTWGLPLPSNYCIPEPRITNNPWSHEFAPSFLNNEQVHYVIDTIRAFVPSLAYTGSTQFAHQSLWDLYQPEAYQDSVAIASLYLCKNNRNKSILTNMIGSKITDLISTSSSWTLSDHLAGVQALIIYQIIRLFDPDLNQQTQAEENNALLELWAAQLWKRSFDEPQAFTNDYDAWVFEESLRRTIAMSVFTRCAWTCMTKDGLVDQAPVLVRLPLTRDQGAWERTSEDLATRSPPMPQGQETLVAYGDFSQSWTVDHKVEQLDPFTKLLLAACRGADDPRLLA
jgi:hypothetical protein